MQRHYESEYNLSTTVHFLKNGYSYGLTLLPVIITRILLPVSVVTDV